MEFFHKATNFPFMATRRVWYTLSIAMVIASIAMFFVRGLNLSECLHQPLRNSSLSA